MRGGDDYEGNGVIDAGEMRIRVEWHIADGTDENAAPDGDDGGGRDFPFVGRVLDLCARDDFRNKIGQLVSIDVE